MSNSPSARKSGKPAPTVEVVDASAPSKPSSSAVTILSAQAGEAMKVIGYDLAYDRDRVIQEARFYMAQSAEAMLEAGRRLLVIKEHEPHGDFLVIVEERLGLNVRAAQRMMAASAKYLLNPALESKATALSLLGKTKLFELMSEADADLAALAEGGTLAGHTLDEVDAMTSRELRAALREAQAEKQAGDALLEKKNKRIDQLERDRQRISKLPLDEAFAALMKEAAGIAADCEGAVLGQLRQALFAIKNHGDQDNTPAMAGLVGQIQARLTALREEFGLPDTSSAAELELLRGVQQWGQD